MQHRSYRNDRKAQAIRKLNSLVLGVLFPYEKPVWSDTTCKRSIASPILHSALILINHQ